MRIAGLNKTTLLDYPGHVAATVFAVGCNFCCPFCHNKDLVIERNPELISEQEVLAFLKKRKGILEGVCITGGEPTLQPDLKDFIRKIKQLGYLVKLDTNGYRPDAAADLLGEHLLDYIAMDIKNSKAKYGVTAGQADVDVEKIADSVELIKGSGIDYEFRTTVIRELHTEEDLMEIGDWIKGSSRYYLQAYEENENVIQGGFHAYSAEEMQDFAKRLTDMGVYTVGRGN